MKNEWYLTFKNKWNKIFRTLIWHRPTGSQIPKENFINFPKEKNIFSAYVSKITRSWLTCQFLDPTLSGNISKDKTGARGGGMVVGWKQSPLALARLPAISQAMFWGSFHQIKQTTVSSLWWISFLRLWLRILKTSFSFSRILFRY